ncbi:MAG: hydrogenase nickel incorporation protein HypB [Bacteroides sp.]|nr:hydrogenase nickel incorporation protein HypB [Bacteroides sp.]
MCTTCGCGNDSHSHHSHPHHHHHDNGDGQVGERVSLEADILGENNRHAAYLRGFFAGRDISAYNIVSSPGSGKTTLLEALIGRIGAEKVAVIEGDQHTDNDAQRITSHGVKAVQINTANGCHLDAHMVIHAVEELNPAPSTVLFIENVGNLVCPALFDLGEKERIVVISVTEGDDKPLKYPYMFAGSQICVINKIDLLPYVDSSIERLRGNLMKINPNLHIFEVSPTKDTGIDALAAYLSSAR